MFDLWTYAPTILFPSSLEWKTKTLIRQVNVDGTQSLAVEMTVHPSTDISDLAQRVLCRMEYYRIGIIPKLRFEYNGEMFGPAGSEPSGCTTKCPTSASLMIPGPIVILILDSTDWSFQEVD